STAADGEKSVINGAINGLQGWIDCFGKAKLTGVLCGVGITNSGEAKQHTALLKDAYVLGNKI
ncbi:MAG: flavodoxin family protein, partial [Oscillospiraceae bacterium]